MKLITPMMAHQERASDKLSPVRIGALFMDMGTGKSRTAIELVFRRQHRISQVIWYCPVSLKETIRREILKHTDCTMDDIHVFDARTSQEQMPDAFWYIVGIESMSASDRVILAAHDLTRADSFVIVDESQYIKGHRASRTNWITDISARARYRLVLSGTPVSQGIEDLYSQMRFLSPKILGYTSWYKFVHRHVKYSDRFTGMIVSRHNEAFIAARIQPYVYQVTRAECLDLPGKYFQGTHYFKMTEAQEEHYEQAKEELIVEIEQEEYSSCSIFKLFTALQQIASGYRRWTEEGVAHFVAFPHRRLDSLAYVIMGIPQGEPVVIWAKFHFDIQGIVRELEALHGQGCVAQYHGKLTPKARTRELDRFASGAARFFVATPSSGGHGLNELISAAWVIFYTNGFKYSERIQAEDRNDRLGQTRRVTYIDISCSCGIDDRILNALANKGDSVAAFRQELEMVKDKKQLIRSL